MFIGGDVSHASPGSPQASMAAITVSFDRFGGRYAAACQTNGHRVEMISESNWNYCFKPLCEQWQANVGGGKLPTQVYYFRDGVSEGQYIQVLNEEVVHIKSVLSSLSSSRAWDGKITVIIAAKRHHSEFPNQSRLCSICVRANRDFSTSISRSRGRRSKGQSSTWLSD